LAKKFRCGNGKVGYHSRRRAQIAVSRLEAASHREIIPHRVYHCPFCRRWHLTSQPKGD